MYIRRYLENPDPSLLPRQFVIDIRWGNKTGQGRTSEERGGGSDTATFIGTKPEHKRRALDVRLRERKMEPVINWLSELLS